MSPGGIADSAARAGAIAGSTVIARGFAGSAARAGGFAVAGFSEDGLDVTVEDNQLVIRGRQKEEPDRIFLYRGIAARQFEL